MRWRRSEERGAEATDDRANGEPHRAIDTPIEHLPEIDEHAIEIDAPAEAAWEALFPILVRAFDSPFSRRVATRLGCAETEAAGDLMHPGGQLPGFIVARSIPPVLLALLGEHRFSRYALIFRIDLLPGQRCRVRAETRAEFPGGKGRLYKGLVIGTRGHVITVRRILRSVRRRAEPK